MTMQFLNPDSDERTECVWPNSQPGFCLSVQSRPASFTLVNAAFVLKGLRFRRSHSIKAGRLQATHAGPGLGMFRVFFLWARFLLAARVRM